MTMTLSKPTRQAASAESYASELEALFQQHWERLCSALLRITGDPAEAQDLALETFVRQRQSFHLASLYNLMMHQGKLHPKKVKVMFGDYGLKLVSE